MNTTPGGEGCKQRTPNLYCVNFEVSNLKLFLYLAFPLFINRKTARKILRFDGELMTASQKIVVRISCAMWNRE